MKKLLASILVVAIVLTSIEPIQLVKATEATETTETTDPVATIADTEETTTEDGIYFYTQEHDYYYSDETKAQEVFSQFPATIEVTIKTAQYRPGVIIGNNTQKAPATSSDAEGTFSLGLYLGRLPYMYIDGNVYWFTVGDDTEYSAEATSRLWHGADYIPLNTWTHLTIVNDVTANDGAGEMRCYINGSLKVTKAGAYTEDWTSSTLLCLGGNILELGSERFKDYIKNVAIYSDVRSGDEITADATAMTADGAYTPDTTDTNANLMACYSLSTEVKTDGTRVYPLTLTDLSGNGLNLSTHWLEESQKEDVQARDDYDYSMAVIGDPQVVTHYSTQAELYPTGTHKDKAGAIDSIFTWIKDNAESKNIKFAMNLGDTVNTSTNETTSATQWDLGSAALESLTGTVPWSVVRGNHDSIEGFVEHFSYEEHKNRISGSYDENMLNTYQKFQVGDIKYLVLSLDFGIGASYGTDTENGTSGDTVDVDSTNDFRMTDGSGNPDKVLAWANEVVKANPEYNVIVTTHGYTSITGERLSDETGLYTDSPTCTRASREGYFREYGGEGIYQNLIKDNSNIVLVLSGHIAAGSTDPIRQREVTREDGSTVVEMLVNPQYVDKSLGLTGMVAMLYFSDGGKTVQVEYYSTLRGRYFFPENQFTMNLNVIDSDVIIGENDSVFLSYNNVDRTGTIPASVMEDYQDYLFAGWYTNAIDEEKYAIKNAEEITEFCYAKFVPANILKTKVQITNKIVTGETSEETVKYNNNYVIRFVSSVDSLNYAKVGFIVTDKDDNPIYDQEGNEIGKSESTKVFSNIKSSNEGSEYEFSPKVISAQSKYLMTAKLPVAPTDDDMDYKVRAYWKTYDGTTVYGKSRCVSVDDNNALLDTTRTNDVINLTVNGELEKEGTYTASFTSSPNNGTTKFEKSSIDVEVLNVGDGHTNIRIKLDKGAIANMASLTKIAIDGTDYYGMYRYYSTTHELDNNDEDGDGVADAYHTDTSWYHEAVALDANADTFVIASSADLYGFAALVDGGTVFANQTVIQVADIRVSDGTAVKSTEAEDGVAKWEPDQDDEGNDKLKYTWNPIGASSAGTYFEGKFDGDYNTISGLYYVTTANYAGLFSRVLSATIQNVYVTNSYIESTNNYLGILGYSTTSTLQNLYSDMILVAKGSGTGYVGGIVGRAQGSHLVQGCWFDGEIHMSNEAVFAGGILGQILTASAVVDVIDCVNSGYIKSTVSTCPIGGIVSLEWNALTLNMKNCLVLGQIEVASTTAVGAFLGCVICATTVNVESCYTTGNITMNGTEITNPVLYDADGSFTVLIGSKSYTKNHKSIASLNNADGIKTEDWFKTTNVSEMFTMVDGEDCAWTRVEGYDWPILTTFAAWWLEEQK